MNNNWTGLKSIIKISDDEESMVWQFPTKDDYNNCIEINNSSISPFLSVDPEKLKALMDLIEKHFIALKNQVRFESKGMVMASSKKTSGLSEKDYKKMFELFQELKNLI